MNLFLYSVYLNLKAVGNTKAIQFKYFAYAVGRVKLENEADEF